MTGTAIESQLTKPLHLCLVTPLLQQYKAHVALFSMGVRRGP